jgi:hypothetical protein
VLSRTTTRHASALVSKCRIPAAICGGGAFGTPIPAFPHQGGRSIKNMWRCVFGTPIPTALLQGGRSSKKRGEATASPGGNRPSLLFRHGRRRR